MITFMCHENIIQKRDKIDSTSLTYNVVHILIFKINSKI